MTTVDKAAVVWTIIIVAIGAGFAIVGEYTPTTYVSHSTTMQDRTMVESISDTKNVPWTRFVSDQDPEIGHEMHQFVMMLEPQDKTYTGKLRFNATEPIELVSLICQMLGVANNHLI